jgi:hypothetical protein
MFWFWVFFCVKNTMLRNAQKQVCKKRDKRSSKKTILDFISYFLSILLYKVFDMLLFKFLWCFRTPLLTKRPEM